MNVFLAWLGSVILLASSLSASEPARVVMSCTSLRFDSGTSGPAQATLVLTSDSNLTEINGELAPFYDPTLPSHGSMFRLEDPTFPDTISGQIAFDTPDPVDLNQDGFDDFFQVSQDASGTTHGIFQTAIDSGSVTAVWNRPAGSTTGTCRLTLVGDTFGELPEFTHSFQLLEYTGTLAYTASTNGIIGTLQLEQTQNAAQKLGGAINASRVETNRLHQFTIKSGTLTNAAGESLSYDAADLQWDDISKTNYFGFLDFADGDPSTSTIDYWDWVLSIDDPNDADGDGIPDLTDDPGAPAAGVKLGLTRAGEQLLLTISGEAPGSYDLEEALSLTQPDWRKTASITLTNATQVVPLAVPATNTVFWRAKKP